jgi:hypothetical protein
MFTDGTRPASIKSCRDAQNSCEQYASRPTCPDLRARPAPMNCPGFRQSQPTNGTVGALPDGVVGEPSRISAGRETRGCQPAHVDAGRRGPLVSFGFSGTARVPRAALTVSCGAADVPALEVRFGSRSGSRAASASCDHSKWPRTRATDVAVPASISLR